MRLPWILFKMLLVAILTFFFLFVLWQFDNTYSFTKLLFGSGLFEILLGIIVIFLPIAFRMLEIPKMASFIKANTGKMSPTGIEDEFDGKFIRIKFGELFFLALAGSIGLLLLAGQSPVYAIFVFPALFIFDLLTVYCSLMAVKLVLFLILSQYPDGIPENELPQSGKPKRALKT